MSRRSAHIISTLAEFLRRFWWATVSGFSVIGGTLYGGAPVAAAWQRYDDPRFDLPVEPDADDVVQREVARGIADLERFLAGHRDIPRRGDHP